MREKRGVGDGRIHTFHVRGCSIPEVYWKALKKVHACGYLVRTSYDRKDAKGKYIDPPSRDAKVMIEIEDPFSQPRYPVLSFSERGKYIAEFLGAKDHLVVPHEQLLRKVKENEEFKPTQWPYCYHQRLTAYPVSDGSTIDQLEICLNKLAKEPITRRAVAITGVPEIDLFMKEDQPCLREIQLRALENEHGELVLNLHARWRSRDLFKAWGDNVIGITNLQAILARELSERTGRKVIVGPYTEEIGSLHIYGQDYSQKGVNEFFKNFPDVGSFIKRAKTSELAAENEVIPQLRELRTEATWRFPPKSIALIDRLINLYETGELIP